MMTVIAYRFTAGRYHATPWGAHVNEGLVEWPPSPFRLLRALAATGFSHFGWTAIEGIAHELFQILASTPPAYALPIGTTGHTRHYMPIYSGKTTKILDTFLQFPKGSTLFVRYDASLPESARELLAALLRAQPYLGRAESWVDAELITNAPEGLTWLEAETPPQGPDFERVELLASEEPDAYEKWHAAFLAQEVEKREKELHAKAIAKGKVGKGLTKSERSKVDECVPRDVVHALLQETGALRKEGWSQPPGTRWVGYFRPSHALMPRVGPPPRERTSQFPTTALLALSSDTSNADVFPRMEEAVRRLDVIHDALVRLSDIETGPSPCFTGRVRGDSIRGHRHARLIPLALGKRRDRLDHVLVHCPMGFDEKGRAALFRIRRTWAKDLPDLFLTIAGIGAVEAFETTVPLVRAARIFRSWTPFVPARFLKGRGKDSLLNQVQRELAFCGLPQASRVQIEAASGQWVSSENVIPGQRADDITISNDGTALRNAPAL